MPNHPYTVTGVKSFRGREGYGFNATLHRDGRKVAHVIDDGNGGCYRYEWLGKDLATQRADATALSDYAATLPPIEPGTGPVPALCVDMLVGELVDEAETMANIRKLLRRELKQRVLFVLDGTVKQTRTLIAITPAILTGAAKQWPTATLLNTLPFEEAVALFRQYGTESAA